MSERLERRFLVLWLLGIALHVTAWYGSSHALPEGILRGVLPAPNVVPDEPDLLQAFSRILIYNVCVAAGIIVVANLFRVRRTPLGYVPVLLHWVLFGLFRGTNSFAVLRARSTGVSVRALIESPGFLELTAYTLVAASTAGIWVFWQDSWLTLAAKRLRSWRDVGVGAREVVGLVVAFLLLVSGAWWEAMRIAG